MDEKVLYMLVNWKREKASLGKLINNGKKLRISYWWIDWKYAFELSFLFNLFKKNTAYAASPKIDDAGWLSTYEGACNSISRVIAVGSWSRQNDERRFLHGIEVICQ